jgi:hypothetical protein
MLSVSHIAGEKHEDSAASLTAAGFGVLLFSDLSRTEPTLFLPDKGIAFRYRGAVVRQTKRF